MKVLLADDDNDQLALRSLLLAKRGFQTFEASDANAAVRIATLQHPDCAVVDLRIPTEAAGLRLIRDLKSIDSNLHVFVLTGADPTRFARIAESSLVDEVIVKGASTASLVEKLRSLAVRISRSS
jgi:two-component system response regulator RegA